METFLYPALTDEYILKSKGLLPEGDYPFFVSRATFGMSKTGNPMVTLTLDVTSPQDKQIYAITDYLMGNGKMAYKLKHFWESVKKPEMNLNGHAYISDFERCKGLVRLAIIDDAQYGQKNRIVDYIEDELMLLDDDIPMNF